jgi:hypothetical protein
VVWIAFIHSPWPATPTFRYKYIILRLKCKEEILFDPLMVNKTVRVMAESLDLGKSPHNLKD